MASSRSTSGFFNEIDPEEWDIGSLVTSDEPFYARYFSSLQSAYSKTVPYLREKQNSFRAIQEWKKQFGAAYRSVEKSATTVVENQFEQEYQLAQRLLRFPSKECRAHGAEIEKGMAESFHPSAALTTVTPDRVGALEATECIVREISFPRITRTFFHQDRVIGKGSNGFVVSTIFSPSDYVSDPERTAGLFLIKASILDPEYPNAKPEGIHEMLIGILICNRLRSKMPNFMFTYGGILCSPPLFDAQSKTVATWCSNPPYPRSSDKLGHTPYVVLENIRPSIEYGESVARSIQSGRMSLDVFLSVFAQIVCCLSVARQEYGFSHFDLHGANVLLRDGLSGNTKYQIPSSGFSEIVSLSYPSISVDVQTSVIAVIIDYGYAFGVLPGAGSANPLPVGTLLHGMEYVGILKDRPNYLQDIFRFLTTSIMEFSDAKNVTVAEKLLELLTPFLDKRSLSLEKLDTMVEDFTSLYPWLPSERVFDVKAYLELINSVAGRRVVSFGVDLQTNSEDSSITKIEDFENAMRDWTGGKTVSSGLLRVTSARSYVAAYRMHFRRTGNLKNFKVQFDIKSILKDTLEQFKANRKRAEFIFTDTHPPSQIELSDMAEDFINGWGVSMLSKANGNNDRNNMSTYLQNPITQMFRYAFNTVLLYDVTLQLETDLADFNFFITELSEQGKEIVVDLEQKYGIKQYISENLLPVFRLFGTRKSQLFLLQTRFDNYKKSRRKGVLFALENFKKFNSFYSTIFDVYMDMKIRKTHRDQGLPFDLDSTVFEQHFWKQMPG